MQNAVSGLVLALLSYLILYTINPDLVKVGFPSIRKIQAPEPVPGAPQSVAPITKPAELHECQINGCQVVREPGKDPTCDCRSIHP